MLDLVSGACLQTDPKYLCTWQLTTKERPKRKRLLQGFKALHDKHESMRKEIKLGVSELQYWQLLNAGA